MELAAEAGLHELAGQRLSVPTDKGANAGAKVAALVAGMCAGADSIDDMAILRQGAMKRLFSACYAPTTLGSFLRSLTFGHVCQIEAPWPRTLIAVPINVRVHRKHDETTTTTLAIAIAIAHRRRMATRAILPLVNR